MGCYFGGLTFLGCDGLSVCFLTHFCTEVFFNRVFMVLALSCHQSLVTGSVVFSDLVGSNVAS